MVNGTKTKVYSPDVNYVGKPQKFRIRSITAILPSLLNGEPTEIALEGQNIWGVAVSQDGDFIRASMAAKAKGVCSTIKTYKLAQLCQLWHSNDLIPP